MTVTAYSFSHSDAAKRRAGQWLIRNRWWVFAGLAAGTIVVGMAGYAATAAGPQSAVDRLYASLQLFVLDFGLAGRTIDWKLQAARFVAPALAAVGTAGAIQSVMAALSDRVPAWRRRDHVIVCGLGRKGLRIVARLAEDRTERVVVIDRDAQLVTAERRATPSHLALIQGDATDPRVLRQAGLDSARAVFAVTGSDAANAAIAVQVQRAAKQRERRGPLLLRTHIVDPELNTLLRPILERDDARMCSHLVNVYEVAARSLVGNLLQTGSATEGVLLLIGFGWLGQSILAELARQGSAQAEPLTVLVVDRNAGAKVTDFEASHRALAGAFDLRTYDEDITAERFEEGDYLHALKPGEDVAHVFVCLGDDELGLVTAFTVAKTLSSQGSGAPVIQLRVTHEGAGFGLLVSHDQVPPPYESVVAFDMHRLSCDPTVFVGEAHL